MIRTIDIFYKLQWYASLWDKAVWGSRCRHLEYYSSSERTIWQLAFPIKVVRNKHNEYQISQQSFIPICPKAISAFFTHTPVVVPRYQWSRSKEIQKAVTHRVRGIHHAGTRNEVKWNYLQRPSREMTLKKKTLSMYYNFRSRNYPI